MCTFFQSTHFKMVRTIHSFCTNTTFRLILRNALWLEKLKKKNLKVYTKYVASWGEPLQDTEGLWK